MAMGTEERQRHRTMTPAARRVLRAAERLFYDRGIHAVGVDLIAAEAEVSKKTLYDRFGSKEQIVVEYLTDRDQRWRALLAGHLDAAGPEAPTRVLTVFDASRVWSMDNGPKGCSMVNAHAEISDPAHPAYPIIAGQKQWMLDLFTDLAKEITPTQAGPLGQTIMLLHEGALVAHGLSVFADPIGHAREQVRTLLTSVEEDGLATRVTTPDDQRIT